MGTYGSIRPAVVGPNEPAGCPGGVFAGRGGLYGDSSFYDAVGTYSLFNTCNTWTARGLQSAGFDIGTAFKARAASVMKFLRRLVRPFDAGCAREAATAFPRSPV